MIVCRVEGALWDSIGRRTGGREVWENEQVIYNNNRRLLSPPPPPLPSHWSKTRKSITKGLCDNGLFWVCVCVCVGPRQQIYMGNKTVKIFFWDILVCPWSSWSKHGSGPKVYVYIQTHFQSPSCSPSFLHLPEIKTSILPRRTRDGAGRL